METRAPYTLIGLFVLTAIAAVFGFVYWLNNAGGIGERTVYRVRFENSVSGMLVGAAVLFNGIRVGEVTDLQLNPDNPKQVMATIAVAPPTPIRADTKAGIDFQGLTGVAVVTLNGGDPATPPLPRPGGAPPVIEADPLAWQNMTQAARTVLQRIDSILTDNAENLKSTIGNINTFSEALARNSQKVDGIVAGLEKMTGGGAAAAPSVVYDLTAPGNFPGVDKAADAQLVVSDPAAVLLFDTQKVLVRPKASDNPTFETARWSDSLPKLVQAKIVQSFENANNVKAVARPTDGFNADYQLLIEIRTFEISTDPDIAAVVELSAKVLGTDGKVVGSRVFRSSVPTKVTDAAAAAAVLNQAFGNVARDLVMWTAETIKT